MSRAALTTQTTTTIYDNVTHDVSGSDVQSIILALITDAVNVTDDIVTSPSANKIGRLNAGGKYDDFVTATLSGDGANTQIPFYTATRILAGNAAFTYDSGAGVMSVGKVLLSSDPTLALHAATKQYVDNIAAGFDVKASVKCATTANISLSGEQTIDGVLTSASRVLVKNQSTTSQNGIYVSGAGAWVRASDMDSWAEVPGAFVFIEQGTTNADTGWVCTADPGGTLESTAVTWSQFAGIGAITTDGQGIEVTGNQLSLELNGTTLVKGASGINVNPDLVITSLTSGGATISQSRTSSYTYLTVRNTNASATTSFLEARFLVENGGNGIVLGVSPTSGSTLANSTYIKPISDSSKFVFSTSSFTEVLKISFSPRGIAVDKGSGNPTAALHVRGGFDTAGLGASFKIDNGTLLSTPEAGAIENNGTHLYWTSLAGTRYQLDQQGGGSGTINSGATGYLALYEGAGTTLDDTWTQNSQLISVAIAAQSSRSAGLTYTIPNPGDAETAATFAMATGIEGGQTLIGGRSASQNLTLQSTNHATRGFIDCVDSVIAKSPIVTETTTSRTLALTDSNKIIRCTNTGAIAISIPLNSSVAFPIETRIEILQAQGAGTVTITGVSGVTVNGTNGGSATTSGNHTARTLLKIATDTWEIY